MSGLKLGSKEKRNYIRMNIETDVACKIRGTNEEFNGLCKNLSHSGLQFTTSKHLKEGSELDVILKTSGGVPQPPLKAILAVKRVSKETEDKYIVSGKLRDVK
jgi:hypothetical protein